MTWTLIAINFAVFIFNELQDPPDLRTFQYLHGLVAARYIYPEWAAASGFPVHDYTPFITSIFMHGSWLHVIMNMWLLWIFGDNIEDRMGSIRFLAFYLVCGVLAGLVHLYTNPDSVSPALGASGAIAGVMGAYYFLFPFARIVIWVLFLPLFVEVPAIAFLGLWVLVQLYRVTTGLHAPSGGASDVAWFGHLGGFIAGMALYRLFLLKARDETV
jgi:membrane associated rhomboid family serine protease